MLGRHSEVKCCSYGNNGTLACSGALALSHARAGRHYVLLSPLTPCIWYVERVWCLLSRSRL